MSLPSLPFISNYETLSGYLGGVMAADNVETTGAIASGLSVLAIGWAEYLARKELQGGQMIVSRAVRDCVCQG